MLQQVSNRWTEGPEMLHARKSHCCGVVSSATGSYLYVAGGTDDQRPVLTAERIRLDGMDSESRVRRRRRRMSVLFANVLGVPFAVGTPEGPGGVAERREGPAGGREREEDRLPLRLRGHQRQGHPIIVLQKCLLSAPRQ